MHGCMLFTEQVIAQRPHVTHFSSNQPVQWPRRTACWERHLKLHAGVPIYSLQTSTSERHRCSDRKCGLVYWNICPPHVLLDEPTLFLLPFLSFCRSLLLYFIFLMYLLVCSAKLTRASAHTSRHVERFYRYHPDHDEAGLHESPAFCT